MGLIDVPSPFIIMISINFSMTKKEEDITKRSKELPIFFLTSLYTSELPHFMRRLPKFKKLSI